ncbi:MAG: hypothetical protein SGI73_08150 [Chloroflexota bacterium]|nr:hypothetical protein [Chloroflexota bacterium]
MSNQPKPTDPKPSDPKPATPPTPPPPTGGGTAAQPVAPRPHMKPTGSGDK